MTQLTDWQILVVEDEFDSAQVVSQILRHYGASVEVAHNGTECLNKVQEADPTLIIMDLNMPEMDGWQTLVKLRSNLDTAHIPVVAITAYHSASVAQDAYQAGFDAYFKKPVVPDDLIKTLTELVNGGA